MNEFYGKVDLSVILYEVKDKVAYLTFNKPETYNAIGVSTPGTLKYLVEKANLDTSVHLIILRGKGESFCSGYDLKEFANPKKDLFTQKGTYDSLKDYEMMKYCTDCYMSLFNSLKPVVCCIQGYAIGGGSDIALCCDIIIAQEDACLGYPPVRFVQKILFN